MKKKPVDDGALKAAEAKALFYETQCEAAATARKAAVAEVERLTAELKKANTENVRVAARLDACLFSMVIMQSVIRNEHAKASALPQGFAYDPPSGKWSAVKEDTLAVAT